MAGLSGTQQVVDIVAASRQLAPWEEPREPEEPRTRPCALGHANALDARVCAEGGLSMNAQPPRGAAPPGPKPAAELTDEEGAERERQHAAAVTATAAFEKAPEGILPAEGEAVLIHFT